MTPVPACTLVSNNYLALARVLAESYREHHPGARVFVCVVDRPHADVDYEALPFETLFVEELGIPGFTGLAFGYGILELNTAVKPFLLEFLRERFGLERVFYLDPDILVLDRLDALAAALERGPMVLTPHITAPLDDARQPSERLILLSGVYNLGFLGLRLDALTAPFLRWWQERLRRFCLHDVEHGLFVDQSWMDLAPALLPDVQIARDAVFNVAYWNLAHRRPVFDDGRWRIDGRPLAFFHFSGLPLDDLGRVSRYQDRIRLAERPELRPLFEHYREILLAAGHEKLRRLPYAFARFADGRPVPEVARRVRQRVDPDGARWADPFACGSQDFVAWLTEPLAFPGGMLTRLALSLWEESAELRGRWADPCGADLVPFVAHLHAGAAARAGLPREFLQALGGAGAGGRASFVEPGGTAPSPPDPPCSASGVTPERQRGRAEWVHAVKPLSNPAAARGSPPTDPRGLLAQLDVAHPGALTAWLNEPLGPLAARPVITRFALHVHAVRADARLVYPQPLGRDRRAFAYWFAVIGADELGVADELVAPVRCSLGLRSRVSLALRRFRRRQAERSAGARREALVPVVAPPSRAAVVVLSTPPPGVNLVGRFESEGDDADAARGTRATLRAAGVAVAEIALDRDPSLDVARGLLLPAHGLPYGLTLVHVGPDELPGVLDRLPLAARAGGRVVGYWFWHLAHFPLELASSCAGLDEVWVPTRFVAAALRPLARVPVHVVAPGLEPLPAVAPSTETSGVARATRSEGEGVNFLAVFDARDGGERFSPDALLEAFERARARCGRRLRLHVHAADADHELRTRLARRAHGLPVTLETRAFARPAFAAQLVACDAFITLPRAESFGRLALHALGQGKPVIVTAGGGPADWLDELTGFPVDSRPGTIERDLPPYPRGALWAEVDVESAAAACVAVAEQPHGAWARASRGQARARLLYGVELAAERWARELARVCAQDTRQC